MLSQGGISAMGDCKGKTGHAENKDVQVGIMKSIFAIVLWDLFTWATFAFIVR